MQTTFRRSCLCLAATALLLAASGCTTSPLGRAQLRLFPESQVAQIGVAAFANQVKETPRSTDAAASAYVECVTRAVTAQVQGPIPGMRPDAKWEVVVFRDESANAFALPGGKIGVHTGMLEVAANQDQLAAVIGHEVAHVLAAHSNERLSTAYAADFGAQLVSVAAGGSSQGQSQLYALLGLGAQVGVLLPFSRTQESEADALGLDLMARAGFDPAQAPELWRNMAAAGGARPPEFLSTHPASETRIRALTARLATAAPIYDEARRAGRAPKCR